METVMDYNDNQNAPLSNDNLVQAISRVMEETVEEECDAKRDVNNVTMDTFCN